MTTGTACKNEAVPVYEVKTGHATYPCVVERGVLARLSEFVPSSATSLFVATTRDVWDLHGETVSAALDSRPFTPIYFPGGEANKRFTYVEALAEQMMRAGADRGSVLIALGGGIATDMGAFLASLFMRGIPVIQVPTTLLAQVDAAIGGKTGVNLVAGKNLIGTFHQPIAVLMDPLVLRTLPEREYRAGLFEVVKHGVIASEELFRFLQTNAGQVLAQEAEAVEYIISESARIKAEVVSADEREGGLRRILNYGHTFGHALEAETRYKHLLHGEAVAFGMIAASHLGVTLGLLDGADHRQIVEVTRSYGEIPSLKGITAESLFVRLVSDKKTIGGKIHFVVPDRIGHVQVVSAVPEDAVMAAIEAALA